ncbi:hypothetical protein Cgig2_013224 [Carnegiea gigantea]|uniref:Uncharacterized protein n=1 Tax=Carnegiea gigantea TaxID=171969 RepID=A0A9Q1QLB7_9CARY|nr:hypothetical protein Cgig2_013224 [Carnegiea gigantea]
MKGKLGSKPKLKIVHSGKPLDPFVLPMENGSSHVKIPGIDVAIPITPIPTIPIQSIAPLPQDKLPIRVYELSTEKGESDDVNFNEEWTHIPLPLKSQSFPSIGRSPPFGKDLFDSGSRLDGLKGVYSPNTDQVEFIHRANAPSLVPCPLGVRKKTEIEKPN